MNWQEKREVKKGNVGEQIVTEHLQKIGFTTYLAKGNEAHGFDIVYSSKKFDIRFGEVKTKPKMNYFNASGFNLSQYYDYKKIQEEQGKDIYIYFVDDIEQMIYGNILSELEKPVYHETSKGKYLFPNCDIVKNSKVILFSRENMIDICKLTPEQCQQIRKHN